MDNGGNDFQGQNLHLAGEENSISPKLRPYTLPKFDFDDSLQGHLKFDSLVENEVFLGIPSEEDNHWIEDFSRVSSGIDAETCSISRGNNVWSEATSSESVEMLLKSVGQEEMVPGEAGEAREAREAVIEQCDVRDEVGSLTKQMESNSTQDDRNKDVMDSDLASQPDDCADHSFGLNETAGGGCSMEGTLKTQECKLNICAGTYELTKNSNSKKCGLLLTEKSMAIDRDCNQNQAETDITLIESTNDMMQKDPSYHGTQVDRISPLDNIASVQELDYPEISKQGCDINVESAVGDPEDNVMVDEGCGLRKVEYVGDHNLKLGEVAVDIPSLRTSVCCNSKVESIEDLAVETSISNSEGPSGLNGDGDLLHVAEVCTEDGCSEDAPLDNNCEDNVLSKSTKICQENKGNLHELPVEIPGHNNFKSQTVDVSNSLGGVCVSSETGSVLQLIGGQSSSLEKEENLISSDCQFNSEASVINCEKSLCSGQGDPFSNNQFDGNSNNHIGNLPKLNLVCPSTELLGGATKNLDGVGDASGPTALNAKDGVFTSMSVESAQICIVDLVSKENNVYHSHNVVRNAKGNTELPSSINNLNPEIVSSLRTEKEQPSVEIIKEKEMMDHGLKCETSARIKPALQLTSKSKEHHILDGVPLLSGNSATANEVSVQSEKQKQETMLDGVVMELDTKEDTRSKLSTEVSLSTLEACLHGPMELISDLVEKGAPVDFASTVIQETVDKSLPMVDTCNEASQSAHALISHEVSIENSKKLEASAVHCGLIVKDDNVEGLAVLGSHEEEKMEENHEMLSSKVSGRGCSTGCEEAKVGSPVINSSIGLSKSEKEGKMEVKGSLDKCDSVSKVTEGCKDEVKLGSLNLTENKAAENDRSFTFPSTGFSEIDGSKGWQSFPTIKTCQIPNVVEGSPSTPSVGQIGAKLAPKNSCRSPQAADRENPSESLKGTRQRRARGVSGKTTGKEKKGKQTTPARRPERGDKPYVESMSPSGAGQLEGSKRHGEIELSATKSFGVTSNPASSLPDLNSSTPPSTLFHQPFTDLQQVQLRAQIFVYGSLIQGSVPDEACMISAFGTADGGRSNWEPVWRTCVERIQGQKSHFNTTPSQSHSGVRAADQATKPAPHQNKMLLSPIGKASSKNISSPINSMVPLSSPLWNVSTSACEGLQSSSSTRGPLFDYHQALSPLHPYQSPPAVNFVGHNWMSQAPPPGAWVASPQTSAFGASSRFSILPITESVKLTPIKESSIPISSGAKLASPIPVVPGGGPSVSAGASFQIDMKSGTQSLGQCSANPRSRKKKKVSVSEDVGKISLLAQTRTELFPAPPVVTGHMSTSVVVSTSASVAPEINSFKMVPTVFPTSSIDRSRGADQNVEKKIVNAEETSREVEAAKQQAEDAAALASSAVDHCQGVWAQLENQKTSRLISESEAKVASAAVAIAAATAVAKAAAAAAKIASNAALQAKLMADEALCSSGIDFPQSAAVFPCVVKNLGTVTPASILKGGDGSNCSSSIIVAAREAARKRVEAASAASRHAQNLDAIVKAAELAAEAVSQAGKIATLVEPLPLNDIVKSGPEGYWKVSPVTSELGAKSNNLNGEQSNANRYEEGSDVSAKHFQEISKEMQIVNPVMLPFSGEISRKAIMDHARLVDSIPSTVTNNKKDSREQKDCRASDLAKSIAVVPESDIAPSFTTVVEYEKTLGTSKENSIKEGCLVEVFKSGYGTKAAWFSANVLSVKDGNVFVCYTELQSNEGSGFLKEWIALKGNNPPKVRVAHPVCTMRLDGTRKRRRAEVGEYMWSVGDRVDACIENCWREGVITEKSVKDGTTLTVHFPAEGETSIVRAWHLRRTLIWEDGEWVERSSSREKDRALPGDSPLEKRLKVGDHVVEGAAKEKMSSNVDILEFGKPEQPHMLSLSANEKLFNVGKQTEDDKKPETHRTTRTGQQKERSKVIFGVPKPGKKRKFMDVSKHYVAERSNNKTESSDSVKVPKYLIPHGPGSRRFKNNSKFELKEKQVVESEFKVLKSGKPQSIHGRGIPQKNKISSSTVFSPSYDTTAEHVIKESLSTDKNESGQQNLTEAEGLILSSSLNLPSDAPKKNFASKTARLNKVKVVPSGVRSAQTEVKDKFYNGDPEKSISENTEPRRSVRRIQPTSRLLEGLQSSLVISKIPSWHHDRSRQKTQSSRGGGTLKGNK